MTTLKQRLRDHLTDAIRARDEVRTATLRMALAAITTEEVSGRAARVLSDDDVVAVLGREAKKRREAEEAYEGAGRVELAARERAELAVLQDYLPEQLSQEELNGIVEAAIASTGASGPRGMGVVMKAIGPRIAGRADGARVAAEVRRQLEPPQRPATDG